MQAPDKWLNYNRYAYCYGNPFKYTDPNGEIALLTAIILGAAVSTAINYGIQVTANHANNPNADPKDIWWGNIDFLDVMTSAVIGAISAGAGTGVSASTAVGKSFITFAKSSAWQYGSVIVGSGIMSFFDWTQNNNFEVRPYKEALTAVLFNMAVSHASYTSGKAIGDFSSSFNDLSNVFVKGSNINKTAIEFGIKMSQALLYELLPTVIYDHAIDPMFPQENVNEEKNKGVHLDIPNNEINTLQKTRLILQIITKLIYP